MSGPARFSYDALPQRVVFGPGVAREGLGAELDRLGAQRALVVCTPEEEELARELSGPLGAQVAGTFAGARAHVPVAVAEAAREAAAACSADVVVSVGGGSTTGTAKAVALTTGLPVVAVPTTYAGSEVTPVWGLTEHGRKRTGTDRRVLPVAVLYDAELTVTLPAALSVASGLNALAHCVEALWAPGANPVTSLLAVAGIGELATGLPGVLADPADLPVRGSLLQGAWLAGSAFAVAGSGLHHKLCHALGGQFDLPHAETHAVVLPYATAVMAPGTPGVEARITAALGAAPGAPAAAALRDLDERLGAPSSLGELGFTAVGVDPVAEQVAEALAETARPVGTDAIRALLRAALDGLDPTTLEAT